LFKTTPNPRAGIQPLSIGVPPEFSNFSTQALINRFLIYPDFESLYIILLYYHRPERVLTYQK
jgi:hypothetical protein